VIFIVSSVLHIISELSEIPSCIEKKSDHEAWPSSWGAIRFGKSVYIAVMFIPLKTPFATYQVPPADVCLGFGNGVTPVGSKIWDLIPDLS